MSVVLLAHYEVPDSERFLAAFDDFDAERRRSGALTHGLVRSLDDPRAMVAVIAFGSRPEAEAFAASPQRAAALRDAGVTRIDDQLLEAIRPIAAVAAA